MDIFGIFGKDSGFIVNVVMALTIPIAMLAIRLAERAMKKSVEALN